ncbi:hypothetical protein RB601_005529 [Gaeumannomyces tritici]
MDQARQRYMEANHDARSSGGPGATNDGSMADDNSRSFSPLQPAMAAGQLPPPPLHVLHSFHVGMARVTLPLAEATSDEPQSFTNMLPAPAAPSFLSPALLSYHPGPAISHHQAHPQVMPCDPSPWDCAHAERLASPSTWCTVRSPPHLGHDVGGPQSLSHHIYVPALVPAAAGSLPGPPVSGTDLAGIGVGPGAAKSDDSGELRLAVPPPLHGGVAPIHLVGPAVSGVISSFPADLSGYDLSAFPAQGHFVPPAPIGPEPLQRPPEPLPDSSWQSDYAWRSTHVSFTDPLDCPSGYQPHSPSGNVTTHESSHVAQPARSNIVPARPQKAIAPLSSLDKSQASPAFAATSGPSRYSQNRQKMEPYMSRFATSSTKRKSFSPGRRQEVAETRKNGACFTCRLQKGPCGIGGVGTGGPNGGRPACKTCRDRQERNTNPELVVLCYRLDLKDCCVFRRASPLHRVEGRETMCWDPSNAGITSLQVKMTGLIGSKPLEVQCRSFRQVGCDRLGKNIGGSTPGEVWTLPPLAATRFAEIRRALEEDSLGWCVGFISALRSPHLNRNAQTLAEWLYVARQYADDQPKSLTYRALQLWTGANLAHVERGLTGEETLNIRQVQDEGSALNGLVPIPPMLDLQIDTVIIRWMCVVQDDLMKDVFKKIRDKNKQHFLDIFLAIFVLCCTAECVAREQEEFVKEYAASGEKGVYFYVKDWSDNMVSHLDWSVRHLIYTFKKGAEHIMPVGLPSLPKAAGMAKLSEKYQSSLRDKLESLATASVTPIRLEYTTTTGVKSELSWTLPLLEHACEARLAEPTY